MPVTPKKLVADSVTGSVIRRMQGEYVRLYLAVSGCKLSSVCSVNSIAGQGGPMQVMKACWVQCAILLQACTEGFPHSHIWGWKANMVVDAWVRLNDMRVCCSVHPPLFLLLASNAWANFCGRLAEMSSRPLCSAMGKRTSRLPKIVGQTRVLVRRRTRMRCDGC